MQIRSQQDPTVAAGWNAPVGPIGGDAFRHHLLRLHQNPARRRCYPCGTHARGAKARLLLTGINGPPRRCDINDRRRLWRLDDTNRHARRWGVRSRRILTLHSIQRPSCGNNRHAILARISDFPQRRRVAAANNLTKLAVFRTQMCDYTWPIEIAPHPIRLNTGHSASRDHIQRQRIGIGIVAPHHQVNDSLHIGRDRPRSLPIRLSRGRARKRQIVDHSGIPA